MSENTTKPHDDNGRVKIIRAATVSMSLDAFCSGVLSELSRRYEVVAVSSPDALLDEVAEREGVRAVGVRMERHPSPLRDLRSLWQMYRVFRRERPHMVHSMTPKAGLVCMVAGWLARVPVRVHTFTGLVFPTSTGLRRRVLMATDWATCACATHVVPEGQGVLNDLKNNHITNKPMRVLGHGNVRGIDLNHYDRTPQVMAAAQAHKAADGVLTFISIGRMVGDKGINELVEAFLRLHALHPDTRLLLVGPTETELDPLKPETLKAIDDNDCIEAVGSQKDVREWLAASDVAVLASYREGFPNVVIEAGAMGLPQVVTDINGAREIVIEGENGTIVPARSADALFDAMERMMDSTYRSALAANARRLIAERYEQGYVRKCLYEFYDEIINR